MDSLQTIHTKSRNAYNLAGDRYHDLFSDEINEKEYDRRLLDIFSYKFSRGSLLCDAGCGPSAHIGRYVSNKGLSIVGADISDRCIALAQQGNPGMTFVQSDLAQLPFQNNSFDGIISYYSIIHSPKRCIGEIFGEFYRVLKPKGYLLVAVKAGMTEGYLQKLLGFVTDIYCSFFTEEEVVEYLEQSGFLIEFLDRRAPYDCEIGVERIFAVGKKSEPCSR